MVPFDKVVLAARLATIRRVEAGFFPCTARTDELSAVRRSRGHAGKIQADHGIFPDIGFLHFFCRKTCGRLA